MNKHKLLIISLLISVVALQGMFKEKTPTVQGNKIPIKHLDQVKDIKDFQLQHRGKHEVFKNEHNQKIDDKKKEDK